MATQEDDHVSLKVVVHKETKKVLFAKVEKDFVDVLFTFLTLPLGTIVRLAENESNIGPVTIGSLNSLYHSVAALDDNCLWIQEFKEWLLRRKTMAADFWNPYKINIGNHTALFEHYKNEFVKDAATFVITDDLTVKPNSLDYSILAQLQDLGIKSPSSLKEITMNVTKEKVLDFLKCSLLSKSCLTDFLSEKKPSIHSPPFFVCSAENTSSINFKLKLFIRKSDNKILYAQVENVFADLLLSFLSFPLGGVVKKLGGNSCLGSIDGLYKSIADMNENLYFMSKTAKNKLVDPPLKLLTTLIDSPTSTEGILKGPRMFVVTDDFVIAPSSPTADLHLISHFNTSFLDVKEKVVTIGIAELFNILKASLISTSVLTTGLAHLLFEVTVSVDVRSLLDDAGSSDDTSSSSDDTSCSSDDSYS